VQPLASRGPGSLELTDSIEISHHVLYARICQIIGIVANMSLSCASQEIKGSPVKRVRAKSPAGPSNQSNCAPWGPKKSIFTHPVLCKAASVPWTVHGPNVCVPRFIIFACQVHQSQFSLKLAGFLRDEATTTHIASLEPHCAPEGAVNA
jgi:hypothetical protein